MDGLEIGALGDDIPILRSDGEEPRVSYASKHLIAGEQVQYETKLHWVVMLGHVTIAVILAIVGAGLLADPWRTVQAGAEYSGALRWAGVASLVAAVIFLAIGLIRRDATEMAVTNKR